MEVEMREQYYFTVVVTFLPSLLKNKKTYSLNVSSKINNPRELYTVKVLKVSNKS